VREVGVALFGLPCLGEPKVQDLDLALSRYHHVGRFEVTMDDPQGVSDLESLGNLAGGLKSIIHRERSLLDPHGQGLAFGQLHDEEALPFVFFETVEGGDILVAERGEQLGPRLVLRYRRRQHLDRHIPIKPLVVGPVHLAHPAFADLVDDAVVTEGATDEVLHCWDSQQAYGIAAPDSRHAFLRDSGLGRRG
jgi:hypothetical protein